MGEVHPHPIICLYNHQINLLEIRRVQLPDKKLATLHITVCITQEKDGFHCIPKTGQVVGSTALYNLYDL